jgi:hypothetical protein
LEIVSSTDTPQQVAAALEAHGYIPETPVVKPPAVEPETEQSATDPDAQPSSEPVQTAGESETPTSTEQPSQGQPQPTPKKKSAQERINEITRQKNEEKRRADALEARLTALEANQQAPPAAVSATPEPEAVADDLQPPKSPKAPRQSQFETIEDYEEAFTAYETANEKYQTDLIDFTRNQTQRDSENRTRTEAATAQVETKRAAIQQSFETCRTDAAMPNFDAVAFSDDVKIAPAMLDAVMDSDDPGKVLYYLGSHPDEAATIVETTGYDLEAAKKHPSIKEPCLRAAGRHVARIEFILQGNTAAPLAATPAPGQAPVRTAPRTTNAPAPIKPLNGAGSAAPSTVPPSDQRIIGQHGWTAADERKALNLRRRP